MRMIKLWSIGVIFAIILIISGFIVMGCARSCEDYKILEGYVEDDEGYTDFSRAYCEKKDLEYDNYRVTNKTLVISCCKKSLF